MVKIAKKESSMIEGNFLEKSTEGSDRKNVIANPSIKLKTLTMSPLRKLTYFIKLVILDEILISQNSVMPEYQLIEKNENIAKRAFFDFVSFRSGLNYVNRMKPALPPAYRRHLDFGFLFIVYYRILMFRTK